jgi:Fe2+ transport system protein FeoA
MFSTVPIDSPSRKALACELCPLHRVKTGLTVRVKKLMASPEVAHRLREIGIAEEQLVRLIATQANVICLVCNARLALSTALAETILVEPVVA